MPSFLLFTFPFLQNNPGIPKVKNMGRNDQNNGKREQNQLINMPILLRKQEKHACGKKQKRDRAPVMPDESMTQGKHAHNKSQEDHTRLKPDIMDDINSENR
jgi:hypothetical protein